MGEVAHTQSGMQSGMHTAMRPRQVVLGERDEEVEDMQSDIAALKAQLQEQATKLTA